VKPAPTNSWSPKADPTRTPDAKPLLKQTPAEEFLMTGDIDRDGVAETFFKDCSEQTAGNCVISIYRGTGRSLVARLVGNSIVFTESYTHGYRTLIVFQNQGTALYRWDGSTYAPSRNWLSSN
jgi:hypothetical protein